MKQNETPTPWKGKASACRQSNPASIGHRRTELPCRSEGWHSCGSDSRVRFSSATRGIVIHSDGQPIFGRRHHEPGLSLLFISMSPSGRNNPLCDCRASGKPPRSLWTHLKYGAVATTFAGMSISAAVDSSSVEVPLLIKNQAAARIGPIHPIPETPENSFRPGFGTA